MRHNNDQPSPGAIRLVTDQVDEKIARFSDPDRAYEAIESLMMWALVQWQRGASLQAGWRNCRVVWNTYKIDFLIKFDQFVVLDINIIQDGDFPSSDGFFYYQAKDLPVLKWDLNQALPRCWKEFGWSMLAERQDLILRDGFAGFNQNPLSKIISAHAIFNDLNSDQRVSVDDPIFRMASIASDFRSHAGFLTSGIVEIGWNGFDIFSYRDGIDALIFGWLHSDDHLSGWGSGENDAAYRTDVGSIASTGFGPMYADRTYGMLHGMTYDLVSETYPEVTLLSSSSDFDAGDVWVSDQRGFATKSGDVCIMMFGAGYRIGLELIVRHALGVPGDETKNIILSALWARLAGKAGVDSDITSWVRSEAFGAAASPRPA